VIDTHRLKYTHGDRQREEERKQEEEEEETFIDVVI
jgi:hypothetical protein